MISDSMEAGWGWVEPGNEATVSVEWQVSYCWVQSLVYAFQTSSMHIHACCHVIPKNYAVFFPPCIHTDNFVWQREFEGEQKSCFPADANAEDMHKGQCVYQ